MRRHGERRDGNHQKCCSSFRFFYDKIECSSHSRNKGRLHSGEPELKMKLNDIKESKASILSWIAIALCIFGCYSPKPKTKPTTPPVPKALSSIPQRAVFRTNTTALVAPPARPIRLLWDWDSADWFRNSSDIYVYSSTNLKVWSLKTNSISLATRTNVPTGFVFSNDRPYEFYRVWITNVSMRMGWFVTTRNDKG